MRASVNGGVLLDLKAFLSGPFDSGLMNDDLRTEGIIPLSQPYSGPSWNYNGDESVTSIPADVVDWVLISLWYESDLSAQAARQAAFIKKDGSIVDLDGLSDVRVYGIPDASYYLIVEHRNHLGVMSETKISPGTGACSDKYCKDFTLSDGYGTNGEQDLGEGVFGLWGGEGNIDGSVTSLDFVNVWLPQNGDTDSYTNADFNMDASTSAFDFLNVWLPANGRASQVPD